MNIIVLAKRNAEYTLDQIRPQFKAEVEAVWDLYTQGFIREFYTRADNGGPAILFVESESIEAAQERLATLPMVARKMLDLELIPLAPFRNLDQLFDSKN